MITVLILWFTWAGSMWGWKTPAANAISGGICVAWVVWLLVTEHGAAIADFVTKMVTNHRPGQLGCVTNLVTNFRGSCDRGDSVPIGDKMRASWIQIINSLSPIELALWSFMIVVLLTTIFSRNLIVSWWRASVLLAYLIAFYVVKRRYTYLQIARGVVWAGWILFSLGIAEGIYRLIHGLSWTLVLFANRNVIAMIWGLMIPVGVGYLVGWRRAGWLALGCMAMGFSGSRGGILALAVVLLVLCWPNLSRGIRYVAIAGIVAGGVCLVYLVRYDTALKRLEWWTLALRLFVTSPLWGTGPGTGALIWPGLFPSRHGYIHYFHAHNFVATVGMEMGIIGLIALACVVYEIWRMRHNAPRWALAALAGFAFHSLVDEPLWFWGPGLGVMAILALLSKEGVEQ